MIYKGAIVLLAYLTSFFFGMLTYHFCGEKLLEGLNEQFGL